MATILHVSKTTPEPEITHIDIRLSADEAWLIGGLVARLNGSVERAITGKKEILSPKLFNTFINALGVAPFNDGSQCLAIVPNCRCVDDRGYSTTATLISDPAPIRVVGPSGYAASLSAEQAASKIESLLRENDRLRARCAVVVNNVYYTHAEAERKIKDDAAEIARLKDELAKAKKDGDLCVVYAGNNEYSLTQAADRIEKLERQQATLLDKIRGAIRNIDAARLDLA